MGQITLFPRYPQQDAPVSEPTVEEVVVVGVEAVLEGVVPERLIRVDDQLGLRYLAEWELTAAGFEPAAWVGPQQASTPARRLIAITINHERIEQDALGALYSSDQGRIGKGLLVSFCALPAESEHALALGQRPAWLLAQLIDQHFELAVHVGDPLLWVYAQPKVLGVRGVFGGWTTAATFLARADHDEQENNNSEPTPIWEVIRRA